MTASERDPNYGLAPENDASLNRDFYASRPYAYFNQRLETLLLVAARPEELTDLLAQGVQVGKLQAGGQKTREPKTDEGRAEVSRDHEAYVVAETAVLLHHAAETLLRLFLAHEGLPPCPWLDMAGERSFRAFKKKVRVLADGLATGDRRESLAQVFFGAADRDALKPTPNAERWHAGLENLEAWLGFYAEHFLDAHVYNAAKHGLAIRGGNSSFQLGDDPLLSASGPSLEYLEVVEQEGRRRWQRTTQWLDLDRSLAYVFMAYRLMKGLWSVASARYVGSTLRHLDLFTEPRFDKTGPAGGIEFTKLSLSLVYYAEPGDQDAVPIDSFVAEA